MRLRIAKESSKLALYIEEDNPLERHVASVVINNYVAKTREQHVEDAVRTATLFTAAPDLFRAGQRMLVKNGDPEWYEGIRADAEEELKQAIAKAEGRS